MSDIHPHVFRDAYPGSEVARIVYSSYTCNIVVVCIVVSCSTHFLFHFRS